MSQVIDIEGDPSRVVVGNVWLMAAAMIRSEVTLGGGPMAITLDRGGLLEAFARDHPDFAEKVASENFVCMVSSATDPHRIASRIRAAAERCAE